MNIELLKSSISSKFDSQEEFSNSIGVSRRTLQNWFTSNKVPTDKIFTILAALDLDEQDEEALLALPKLEMVFRAKLKKPTTEANKAIFRNFADTFIKLNGRSFVLSESFPRLAPPFNKATVVKTLRSLLNLKESEPAKLFDVLERLKEFNIQVVFFPFNKLDCELEKDTKEVAFTAMKEDQILIFLDANRTLDESLFDLLHELTHIICNHIPETTTVDDETFCNEVAQELIYPLMFYVKNTQLTGFFKTFTYKQMDRLREVAKSLFTVYDWSPIGLALSLSSNGIIQKSSNQFKNLMSMNGQFHTTKKNISELFFENFNPNDLNKFLNFFSIDIYKNKDIYKGFIELKNGTTSGHLSSGWLAELFKINPGDMDEVVKIWIEEERHLISQELVDSAARAE